MPQSATREAAPRAAGETGPAAAGQAAPAPSPRTGGEAGPPAAPPSGGRPATGHSPVHRRPSLRWRERRLLAGLRRQDPEAVNRLNIQYGRTLHGYLTNVLGDRHAAEDVLQQVLLEAWQRGPAYDPTRGSLLTWLLTIARSRAIDATRVRIPTPTDPAAVTAARDLAGEGGDELDRLLVRWQLAHLLTRLPAGEHEILRLRFERGLSQREIAVTLGMPLGTVKMRMVSGLERLRKLLVLEEPGA